MTDPILSIVIPSYNSEKFINQCLQSVEAETCDDIEFILVDGGSVDRTMEIVGQYKNLFTHIISEPDQGQSDAFNKGFKLARGKFLSWLNSDDVLCDGALENVLLTLRKTKKDWLTANCIYFDANGKIIRCCRSGGFESFAVKNGVLNVFGPSTFFSKKLYQEIGEFNQSFHYCMDTDYWWRIVKSGRSYERINNYFWGLRLHSDAKTASTILKGEYPAGMREESNTIADCYYPHSSIERRKRAVFMVRVWRVINLSYIKAFIDTLRMKGKAIKN